MLLTSGDVTFLANDNFMQEEEEEKILVVGSKHEKQNYIELV